MPSAVPAKATGAADLPLRYDLVAAGIHWVTAALIVAQLLVGFIFHAMERGPLRSEWFGWHKTLGVTILALALARLAWRLGHKPPPWPTAMPRWEKSVAAWSHRLFYFVLIATPLTGLLAVSAYADQSVIELVGGLEVPPIPGISEGVGETFEELHKHLVQLVVLLIGLHVLAAVRHQWFGRRRSPAAAAGRMPPFAA